MKDTYSAHLLRGKDESPVSQLIVLFRDVWSYLRDLVVLAVLGSLLLALVLVDAQSLPGFLSIIRVLLGLFFALFVPGYTLHLTLFPRNDDLDGPERLALSFVLSVAVLALLALVLDHLPWGIHLWPVVALLGFVVLVLSYAAMLRRLVIPVEDCFVPSLHLGLKGLWNEADGASRMIYALSAIALSVALFASSTILILPRPAEQFTEFYLLGPEGLAENFPREATRGEILTVTAGLSNKEQEAMTYRVEIWAVDPWAERREMVGQSIPITLPPGESVEWPLSWAMPWPGQDQKVEFLLFIDDDLEPYRQLRLWSNVEE